jgi:hypothetical protein
MEALFHAIKSAPPPPAASQAPVRGGTRSLEPETTPAPLELEIAVEPSEARSLPAAPRSTPAPRRQASPAPRRPPSPAPRPASLPSAARSEAPPQATNSELPARDRSRPSRPLVAEPVAQQPAGLGSFVLAACTFLLICIAVLLGGAYAKLWPLPPTAAAMLHLDRVENAADSQARLAPRTPPAAAQPAPAVQQPAPSAAAPQALDAPSVAQRPALAPNVAEPQAADAPSVAQRPAANSAAPEQADAPSGLQQPTAPAAKSAEPQAPAVPSTPTRPAVLSASAAAPQRAAALAPERRAAPAEAQPVAAPAPVRAQPVTTAPAPAQALAERASPAAASIAATNLSGEKLLQATHQRARAGDLTGAEALARAAMASDPDDHHAVEALVEVLIEETKGAEAVKYALQIVHKRPKRASYRVLEGDARLLTNDRSGAERAWREALALDPQNRDAKRRLGL